MDLFVGYKIINNPYFFVNKTISTDTLQPFLNTFDVVYEKDAGLFKDYEWYILYNQSRNRLVDALYYDLYQYHY